MVMGYYFTVIQCCVNQYVVRIIAFIASRNLYNSNKCINPFKTVWFYTAHTCLSPQNPVKNPLNSKPVMLMNIKHTHFYQNKLCVYVYSLYT